MFTARVIARAVIEIPRYRTPIPHRADFHRWTRPGRLRVTFVVERLLISGGVLTVIQLTNALIRMGMEVRIATLFVDPLVPRWATLHTQPIVYRNPAELAAQFPPTDIAIATLWRTAPWIKTILSLGHATTALYFLQDYEPWFFPAREQATRAAVIDTFGLIDHRMVTSRWLAERLASHGCSARQVPIGIELDCYYPRSNPSPNPTLIAMARPGTAYRGFDTLIAALSIVCKQRPDLTIRLFGDARLRRRQIPFAFRDEGIMVDQQRLAELYSSADLFVDSSLFQGFGRCALEAMACGTACVLTEIGGVNEYARHGHNALLVSPQAPARLAEQILKLLADGQLRRRLATAGRLTAANYCHQRVAKEFAQCLTELHQGQWEP